MGCLAKVHWIEDRVWWCLQSIVISLGSIVNCLAWECKVFGKEWWSVWRVSEWTIGIDCCRVLTVIWIVWHQCGIKSGLSSQLSVVFLIVFGLIGCWVTFSMCGYMQLSSVVIILVIGAHCWLFVDSSVFGHSLWGFYWFWTLLVSRDSCVAAVWVGSFMCGFEGYPLQHHRLIVVILGFGFGNFGCLNWVAGLKGRNPALWTSRVWRGVLWVWLLCANTTKSGFICLCNPQFVCICLYTNIFLYCAIESPTG